jgi:hypothetical protein
MDAHKEHGVSTTDEQNDFSDTIGSFTLGYSD